MKIRFQTVIVLALIGLAYNIVAEEVYRAVTLDKLTLVEGAIPVDYAYPLNPAAEARRSYAVLDGPGEVYLFTQDLSNINRFGYPKVREMTLVARADAAVQTGRLFVPTSDYTGMIALKFKLPEQAGGDASRKLFFRGKIADRAELLNRQAPGSALFRRQLNQAAEQLPENERAAAQAVRWRGGRPENVADTYALFSGGRAVAENLQLDRALRQTKPDGETATVPIANIQGITVNAFDWTPLIKDLHPAADALAELIPEDQHAIFFPSFTAFNTLLDQADEHSLPLLRLAESRSEDALTRERYQTQLGLSVTMLGKLLGPTLIESVAITGSTPYLRMGSDITFLFQAKGDSPDALRKAIVTQISLNTAATPGVQVAKADGPNYSYSSMTTPDRRVSSYVATFGNVVVVTNSTKQLDAIAAVVKKQQKSLATAPEYTFFRNRYPRGEADQTALLVLSDATIRRWCGPRVRIADARRTAALAVLADLDAARIEGKLPEPLTNPCPTVDLGELTLTPAGVRSSIYNTAAFMTPIGELDLDKVTPQEKMAYERWRDGYQRGYRQFFDPIAVKFSFTQQQLAVDVTVMPLIGESDYNRQEIFQLSKGASLKADSGDPHGALLHLAFAVNGDSPVLKGLEGFLQRFNKEIERPLSWIGDCIAVYADDDPFWQEMAKAPDAQKFLEKEVHRLPVAVRIDCKSGLKLAAFLTAIRAYADQSAPNLVTWENRTHAGMTYVRVAPTPRGDLAVIEKIALYYAPTPEALVLTLSEPTLKRALDRRAAAKPGEAPVAAWAGQNLALHAESSLVTQFEGLMGGSFLNEAQVLAWANLPILNELRRLHPEADPMEMYVRYFNARLLDPAGGKYVWNERFQSYESTTLGLPAAPKSPELPLPYVRNYSAGDFGLTFENDGLRAKVSLKRRQ